VQKEKRLAQLEMGPIWRVSVSRTLQTVSLSLFPVRAIIQTNFKGAPRLFQKCTRSALPVGLHEPLTSLLGRSTLNSHFKHLTSLLAPQVSPTVARTVMVCLRRPHSLVSQTQGEKEQQSGA